MFGLLDKYIARTVLFYIFIASFLILGIDSLFALIREFKFLGEGDYNLLSAFFHVLLTTPRRLYNLFPMTSLLGAVIGLGLIAGRSELIAMRAASFSIKRLSFVLLLVAFIFSGIITFIGEFVAPYSEQKANILRAVAKGSGAALYTVKGIWLKDGNNFIYVTKVMPAGKLSGVIKYEFDNNKTLSRILSAKEALFTEQLWQLFDVEIRELQDKIIINKHEDKIVWHSKLNVGLLQALAKDPEDLSIFDLISYINYLKANKLDNKNYQLELAKKILKPLAIIIMILLAIPFVLGSLRSASMGLRSLLAVITGFAFYVANNLIAPIILFTNLPAWLGAFIPCAIFAIIVFISLSKV